MSKTNSAAILAVATLANFVLLHHFISAGADVAGVGPCSVHKNMFLYCQIGDDAGAVGAPYVLLAAVSLVSLLLSVTALKNNSAVLFVRTVAAITLFAVAVDTLFDLRVLNHEFITNNTFNAYAIVISGTFVMLSCFAFMRPLPLVRVLLAMLASDAIVVLAIVFFLAIEGSVQGATQLWILICLFMWAVFSLHLMTIGTALAFSGNDQAASAPAQGSSN